MFGQGEQDGKTERGQEWWHAVRAIARLVGRDGLALQEDRQLREELQDCGFSSDGIGKALDWVDRAALSGHLLESLDMLQPEVQGVRIEHPIERASISDRLWCAIDSCRRRGIFSPDLSERLLEGVRAMDTRDWDDEEVLGFIAEILAASAPTFIGQSVSQILNGKAREFFN